MRNKDQCVCFLDYILSYLHLFVHYCGYLKMAENSASGEYNLDENSDCEGCKSEDIGYESIGPDSDPDLWDIEVSLVGCREVSNDHIDYGDKWGDNGPSAFNDATVTANANFPKWTTNFTDITI